MSNFLHQPDITCVVLSEVRTGIVVMQSAQRYSTAITAAAAVE